MSETLSYIAGKSRIFATRLMGGGTTADVSVSDIVTLTPPAGQRVRLTHLSTGSGGAVRFYISVLFGSTEVLSNKNISGEQPFSGSGLSDKYSVGSYQDYAAGLPPNQNYEYFTGDVDEALIIRVNQAGGSNTLYYGYEYGE